MSQRFHLSVSVPPDGQGELPQVYEALSELLEQDKSIQVLPTPRESFATAHGEHGVEVRGDEWLSLLIAVVSSGAATALVHAVAACFPGPRISNYTMRLHDEDRKRTIELTVTGLSKEQLDELTQKLEMFFEGK